MSFTYNIALYKNKFSINYNYKQLFVLNCPVIVIYNPNIIYFGGSGKLFS